MTKESPLNFFHSSAKKNKPAESVKSQEQLQPAQELPSEPAQKPISSASSSYSNPLIESMLDRMNNMRKEIDDKIEEMIKNHNVSNEVIRQYLNNPNNFTPEQWEFLQQRDNEFAKKIWASLEPAIGQTISLDVESITKAAKEPPPPAPAKKSKMIGSRRKWISTR